MLRVIKDCEGCAGPVIVAEDKVFEDSGEPLSVSADRVFVEKDLGRDCVSS